MLIMTPQKWGISFSSVHLYLISQFPHHVLNFPTFTGFIFAPFIAPFCTICVAVLIFQNELKVWSKLDFQKLDSADLLLLDTNRSQVSLSFKWKKLHLYVALSILVPLIGGGTCYPLCILTLLLGKDGWKFWVNKRTAGLKFRFKTN